jgi:hypothetical protein
MYPAIKEKWIMALRSGEHKQTKNMLLDYDGAQCCLGVLCDVVAEDMDVEKCPGTDPRTNGHYRDRNGSRMTTQLSSDLSNEVGLTRAQESQLITMNDTAGRDFSEIADYIERNL